MKLVGVEGLPEGLILAEIDRGARFVVYQYCISLLVITFKRLSNVYFIRPGESRITKGLGFSLLTLVLGWWGIPWGPIYTVQSVWVNFSGGRDITQDIMNPEG